jgi:hypothetical protein
MVGAVGATALGWVMWFGIAWVGYGHAGERPLTGLLHDVMPLADIAESHEIVVDAPASVTWGAALALDLERAGVIHAVFAGRRLLLPHADTAAARLTLGQLEAIGWGRVGEIPGREIVFGAVTQPWQSDVRFQPLAADVFRAFDDPGYVKIVWTIAVDSLGPTRSRFRTETRALATDSVSRALFRRYWSWLSPGIVLIRWQAVRLVRADAERLWRRAP